MWLSKMMAKGTADSRAQKGSVTISGASGVEAVTGGGARTLPAYMPYGYAGAAPVGEEVVVLPSTDGEIALGIKCKNDDLAAGEVRITSRGGAEIFLKNDGSVVINSLVIDKNGVMQP